MPEVPADGNEPEEDLKQDEEQAEPRDERIPPLILASAVTGLLIGLFVWGSLAMTVMSSAQGLFDDLNSGSLGPPAVGATVDCGVLESRPARSADEEATYKEQCVSSTPQPGVTPTPDASLNREDCEAIRGTQYRSQEERQWFLANCVT